MKYSTVLRIVRAGIYLGIMGGLCVLGLFLYELYYAPHMKVQPHLKAYEAIMPRPPEGTVPLFPLPGLPSEEEIGGWANPVQATPQNIARGGVYYGYYCVFCHGEEGDGNGPVGQSYMPVPTDLRSRRVQSYDDGHLMRAMLAGTGHAPVLAQVVPPRHRPYLVLYLRHFPTEPGGSDRGGQFLAPQSF